MNFIPQFIRRLFKSWLGQDKIYAPNVANFIEALKLVAPAAGQGSYMFFLPDGTRRGFVQFLIESDHRVQIHRLWTPQPGQGNGAIMLQTLCDLADIHAVELQLKVLPIGRKPYPMSRQQLKAWYENYDFVGQRWKLIRMPRTIQARAASIETTANPEPMA
jgi:hypothetical protein